MSNVGLKYKRDVDHRERQSDLYTAMDSLVRGAMDGRSVKLARPTTSNTSNVPDGWMAGSIDFAARHHSGWSANGVSSRKMCREPNLSIRNTPASLGVGRS